MSHDKPDVVSVAPIIPLDANSSMYVVVIKFM